CVSLCLLIRYRNSEMQPLVWDGCFLSLIDDKHVNATFYLLELEPELRFQGREDVWEHLGLQRSRHNSNRGRDRKAQRIEERGQSLGREGQHKVVVSVQRCRVGYRLSRPAFEGVCQIDHAGLLKGPATAVRTIFHERPRASRRDHPAVCVALRRWRR